MRIWTIVILGVLGACSSQSTPSGVSSCCIINPGGDAGPGPSCWCPGSSTGSSITTTITGASCTVTITSAPDSGSPITAQGTVPTSAAECAMDLPIGG